MIKILTYRSIFQARSAKKIPLNFDYIEKHRENLIENVAPYYKVCERQHIDRVYQEKLYGRNCNIAGITPNSQNSVTYIKTIFDAVNPDLVILGGFNNSRLVSQLMGLTLNYQQLKQIRTYDYFDSPSKLYCKKLVAPFITKCLEHTPDYLKDEKSDSVFYFDHKNSFVHALNYLTIIENTMYRQMCKLSFGIPSDYIIFEDLIINCTLQDLVSVFDRVLQQSLKNKNEYGEETTSYNFFPDLIIEQMRFNALNQSILVSKELTYMTALLNKSVSVHQRVLLFVPNQYVHQISQNVHKINIDPKVIYNKEKLVDQTNQSEAKIKLGRYTHYLKQQQSIEEILQKLVILTILKTEYIENELLNYDQNIFSRGVFSSIFQTLSKSEVKQKYLRIKQKYEKKIGRIVEKRVSSLSGYKEPQKNFYTLSEMIKTQQQRNIDFPISIDVDNKNTRERLLVEMKKIQIQADRIIKKQLSADEKQLIKAHQQNHVSRESLVLYNKILAQAKLNLKSSVKLPNFHYGSMSAIFKDQIISKMQKLEKKKKHKIVEVLDSLKDKGLVKQIKSLSQIQQIDSIGERLSIDVDSETGDVKFHQDGSYQTLQTLSKLSPIFQQMSQMNDKIKNRKDQEDSDFEEQDELQPKISHPKKVKSIFRKKR